jgi:hypothetical protein
MHLLARNWICGVAGDSRKVRLRIASKVRALRWAGWKVDGLHQVKDMDQVIEAAGATRQYVTQKSIEREVLRLTSCNPALGLGCCTRLRLRLEEIMVGCETVQE